jgi:hypothetical protein
MEDGRAVPWASRQFSQNVLHCPARVDAESATAQVCATFDDRAEDTSLNFVVLLVPRRAIKPNLSDGADRGKLL